jgi:hypothetical protein
MFNDNTTGMTHLKIDSTSQGFIRKYKDLKRRLYNCNATIYFNKQCLKRQVTPKYANIKVPNISPVYKKNMQKIPTIRIKDEIKYLHTKKQTLNQQPYYLHVDLANMYGDDWNHIQTTTETELSKEMKAKYKTLNQKPDLLTKNQTKTPQKPHTFHPRVFNNTNIRFSKGEAALLQKGLKYNPHSKPKKWI